MMPLSKRTMRVRRATPAAAADRRGFTVVEAMVAMMMLVFGVLGLAATAGALSRQMNNSERQMKAASLVRLRVERLGAVSTCASIGATGAVVRGTTAHADQTTERWSLTVGSQVITVLDSVTIRPLTRPIVIESGVRCA